IEAESRRAVAGAGEIAAAAVRAWRAVHHLPTDGDRGGAAAVTLGDRAVVRHVLTRPEWAVVRMSARCDMRQTWVMPSSMRRTVVSLSGHSRRSLVAAPAALATVPVAQAKGKKRKGKGKGKGKPTLPPLGFAVVTVTAFVKVSATTYRWAYVGGWTHP